MHGCYYAVQYAHKLLTSKFIHDLFQVSEKVRLVKDGVADASQYTVVAFERRRVVQSVLLLR
jgi:hypothetical protein